MAADAAKTITVRCLPSSHGTLFGLHVCRLEREEKARKSFTKPKLEYFGRSMDAAYLAEASRRYRLARMGSGAAAPAGTSPAQVACSTSSRLLWHKAFRALGLTTEHISTAHPRSVPVTAGMLSTKGSVYCHKSRAGGTSLASAALFCNCVRIPLQAAPSAQQLAPAALTVQQPTAVPQTLPAPAAASYPTPSYYPTPVPPPAEVRQRRRAQQDRDLRLLQSSITTATRGSCAGCSSRPEVSWLTHIIACWRPPVC